MISRVVCRCGVVALSAEFEHIELLRRGPRVWNAWRRQNTSIIPNLTRIFLSVSERQMGPINGGPINLAAARLRKASLRFATLTGANLEAADLSGADLTDARLDGANLANADLRDAVLDRTDFAGADLTCAVLGGVNLSEGSQSDAGPAQRRRGRCVHGPAAASEEAVVLARDRGRPLGGARQGGRASRAHAAGAPQQQGDAGDLARGRPAADGLALPNFHYESVCCGDMPTLPLSRACASGAHERFGKAFTIGASSRAWSQAATSCVSPSRTMTRSREGTIATICWSWPSM